VISGIPNVPDEIDSDDDATVEPSSIQISLHLPTTIIGNNNTVLVSPFVDASAVMNGIFKAIKEASACSMGVPMIDEDGAPRRMNIKVDGAFEVRGNGNVLSDSLDAQRVTRRLGATVQVRRNESVAEAAVRIAPKRAREEEEEEAGADDVASHTENGEDINQDETAVDTEQRKKSKRSRMA
jgi:hypothetical protein